MARRKYSRSLIYVWEAARDLRTHHQTRVIFCKCTNRKKFLKSDISDLYIHETFTWSSIRISLLCGASQNPNTKRPIKVIRDRLSIGSI